MIKIEHLRIGQRVTINNERHPAHGKQGKVVGIDAADPDAHALVRVVMDEHKHHWTPFSLSEIQPVTRPLSSLHPGEWDELCWLAFETRDTVCFSLAHDNETLIDCTISGYIGQQLFQLTISPLGQMQASVTVENDTMPTAFNALTVLRYLDSLGIALGAEPV